MPSILFISNYTTNRVILNETSNIIMHIFWSKTLISLFLFIMNLETIKRRNTTESHTTHAPLFLPRINNDERTLHRHDLECVEWTSHTERWRNSIVTIQSDI